MNAALNRVTGYELSRDPELEPAQFHDEAARAEQARVDRRIARLEARQAADLLQRERQRTRRREIQRREIAARRLEAKRAAAHQRATGADLPAYFDDETRQIVARVRPRTMTSPAKLQSLIDATRYVVDRQVPGAVVECGVWRGGSMQAVALTLLARGDADRDLHLYDTFTGMSEPTAEDVRAGDGRPAEQLLAESRVENGVLARANLADVRQGMDDTGYPADRLHYHVGKVEDTIPDDCPDQIALLRLDTDWYESTRHELNHLWPRLAPGGILILDDFGDWEGARKATLEWLEATGVPLFLAPMGSGRIAVKPTTSR